MKDNIPHHIPIQLIYLDTMNTRYIIKKKRLYASTKFKQVVAPITATVKNMSFLFK